MTLLEYLNFGILISCPVCGNAQPLDVDKLTIQTDEIEKSGRVSVDCEECDAMFHLYNNFETATEYVCRFCHDGDIEFIDDHFNSESGHWTTASECEFCAQRNRE